MEQNLAVKFIGHVSIRDRDTLEELRSAYNAVHPQNMARAIARSLANEDQGAIFKVAFGNGGTFLNSSSQIIYRSPNILGASDLYNATYEVQVDQRREGTPESNTVLSSPSPNPSLTSVVTVSCILNSNEPPGQQVSDNVSVNTDGLFFFDEIGLKTIDGLLLSHLVFSPIEKTANRAFLVTYTLTISVS